MDSLITFQFFLSNPKPGSGIVALAAYENVCLRNPANIYPSIPHLPIQVIVHQTMNGTELG